MDIDPYEIKNEEDQNMLFDFIERLCGVLQKPATITPENCPNFPYVIYYPVAKSWRVF